MAIKPSVCAQNNFYEHGCHADSNKSHIYAAHWSKTLHNVCSNYFLVKNVFDAPLSKARSAYYHYPFYHHEHLEWRIYTFTRCHNRNLSSTSVGINRIDAAAKGEIIYSDKWRFQSVPGGKKKKIENPCRSYTDLNQFSYALAVASARLFMLVM